MSSGTPVPVLAKTSTATKILDALSASSGLISIAVPIAGTLIPIVVQVVKMIRGSGAAQTVEYSFVVAQNQAMLDAIITAGGADLDLVNAELKRLGVAPLAVS